MKLPEWWGSDKPYKIMDCLEGMKAIPDKSVDAIVTDPPFGIGFSYKSQIKDLNNPEEYWAWLSPVYNEMLRILKDGGLVAIWQSRLHFKYFWQWFGDDIHIYISCKNFVQLRKVPINSAYDPIVMRYIRGEPLCPKKSKKSNRNLDFFVANTAKFITQTTSPAKKHPCPRPIDQVIEIIKNFVVEGGIVIDPFLGSGTTPMACQMTNRICLGFEINPDYEPIIKQRTSQETLQMS